MKERVCDPESEGSQIIQVAAGQAELAVFGQLPLEVQCSQERLPLLRRRPDKRTRKVPGFLLRPGLNPGQQHVLVDNHFAPSP